LPKRCQLQGFFARAGTPRPIIDKLNAALAADFKRLETAERLFQAPIALELNCCVGIWHRFLVV
jgi:hypothetical protein